MMKNKKESIVIFEDWFRYARCLNDTEFRTFMNTILQYYKKPFDPKFTGLMLEVWNDIVDDLETNVNKRQAKRDTMLANSKTNPKLNTVPDIGPDTKSNIEPKTVPSTSGMVDGRLDMVDVKMDDDGFPMVDTPMSQSQMRKLEKFDMMFDDI
jgi:hypothetical protein